jgi:glutamate--cysteine ligase catalytic subunit
LIAIIYLFSGQALIDHIYMDCMCFGMGCSCLQLTLQASHIQEARHLYDQLAVLAPIMLACTASSPIFRGYLADVDCRWNVIAGSVDDRNAQERGQEPIATYTDTQWNETQGTYQELSKSRKRIPKSRYDSISMFISTKRSLKPEYNDLDLVIDEGIEKLLISEHVDPLLAKHYAHLFIRDPLVLYRELLNQDDSVSTDHFENIQSTNWQTMRFKPPPVNSDLGWRVEFRAMEVQLTDFENAAYSVFVVLMSRAILCLNLDLYIPLSCVDDNMKRAQKRDALLKEKFWFRRVIFDVVKDAEREAEYRVRQNPSPENPGEPSDCGCSSFAQRSRSNSPIRRLHSENSRNHSPLRHSTSMDAIKSEDSDTKPGQSSPPSSDEGSTGSEEGIREWTELSIDAIMNGKPGEFSGLIPLVREFFNTLVVPEPVRIQVDRYLTFLSDRAAGRIATTANWMRQFVVSHPKYQQDSKVSAEVAYDLLRECREWSARDMFPPVKPVSM